MSSEEVETTKTSSSSWISSIFKNKNIYKLSKNKPNPNSICMQFTNDDALFGLTSACTSHICEICQKWALLHWVRLQKCPFGVVEQIIWMRDGEDEMVSEC